jgi:hypothetical protein
VPVPVRVTICGLPTALSVMVIAALRFPVAAGVKLTLIVQLAPAATELPQVVVSGKSPGSAPVTAMLAMLKVRLPLLVRVTDCAGAVVPTNWLPKVMVVAESSTPGAAPVPVRFTDCGLPDALSVNTTEAVRVPSALGVKVRLSVHWADGASEEPHVLELATAKSAALGPVTWVLDMFKVALPTLVTWTL